MVTHGTVMTLYVASIADVDSDLLLAPVGAALVRSAGTARQPHLPNSRDRVACFPCRSEGPYQLEVYQRACRCGFETRPPTQ